MGITDGDGDGDGYGDGDGSGFGFGDGSVYGFGDGSVYGDGDGDGSVYGDGSGFGFGFGYGSGDGDLLAVDLTRYASDPRQLAFWWSNRHGQSSNGGQPLAPAAPGVVHAIDGDVALCAHGLHATLHTSRWHGERLWLVALDGQVQGDADKLVAQRRTILAEVSPQSKENTP